MQTRQLGKTNIHTAPLILGGNVFGWTIDEQQSFDILDAFTDAGFNMIDTANSYSRWVRGHKGGESETIIGKWMKQRGNRDKIIVTTKVGSDMGNGTDLSYDYILRAADESLERLQTDYIDLYLSHFDDEKTPVEETMRAMDELVRAGKVRQVGASNLSRERIEESLDASKQHHWARYNSLQPLYNLYDRQTYETKYQLLANDNKLGVTPYYSLASGFLTGKYRSEKDLSQSVRGNTAQKYLNERGLRILAGLDNVSNEHNATPAQVAIAWLIGQPTITAAIASATSREQLDELVKATQLKLSHDDMGLLAGASAY